MVDLMSSPLQAASPSKIQLPGLVAPETLQQAAQMNPMQAMLAQYGLSIPTQEQIPQHFMFSDQQAPAGFPQTSAFGAGFGVRHPALATGIENALLGAAMAPGGMPTAGQNIAQVAGSLTGVPQWRLQRRIGMTLAPLEIAGSMQNILSQQAAAQGQLMTGQGNILRGQGYIGMGQGRQMEALAQMQNAQKVNNLYNMWDKNPADAQKFMDANADMIRRSRMTDPLYFIYSTQGKGAAKDFANLSASLRYKYGHLTDMQTAFNIYLNGTPKEKAAMDKAMKYLMPYYSERAKLGLLGAGTNFNPITGAYRGGGMTQEELQQMQEQYLHTPGAEQYGIPQGQGSPFPSAQPEGGPDEEASPVNPVPGMSNQRQPFGAIP